MRAKRPKHLVYIQRLLHLERFRCRGRRSAENELAQAPSAHAEQGQPRAPELEVRRLAEELEAVRVAEPERLCRDPRAERNRQLRPAQAREREEGDERQRPEEVLAREDLVEHDELGRLEEHGEFERVRPRQRETRQHDEGELRQERRERVPDHVQQQARQAGQRRRPSRPRQVDREEVDAEVVPVVEAREVVQERLVQELVSPAVVSYLERISAWRRLTYTA